jgi:hypothetical protein
MLKAIASVIRRGSPMTEAKTEKALTLDSLAAEGVSAVVDRPLGRINLKQSECSTWICSRLVTTC